MIQGTEEWRKARTGRVTGSVAGAALGLNPYMTPEQLIRQMVREYHGAESDFKSNIATDYGKTHEPIAAMSYLAGTGNHPEECGLFVHPEYDWLGASPDALIDDDGLVEIKCPFKFRKCVGVPPFQTAEEQPSYYAQMQIEMACAGRQWCDFYQWSKASTSLERVYRDDKWLADNIPALKAFHNLYLSELDNPAHLEPLRPEVNTNEAYRLLDQYDEACRQLDEATEAKKDLLKQIVALAGEKTSTVCGRKLTKVERAGSVSYAKAIKEHLPDLDLKPYTGKPSEYWKLS